MKMKASTFEFRFRYWIHAAIIVLGFIAPWTLIHTSNELDVVPANSHVWGVLATDLNQFLFGGMKFDTASYLILVAAILLSVLGAWLRTWATAYLGAPVVNSPKLEASATGKPGLVEDGPYRHLRNPLYVGLFLHLLALCLLMPRSGAIFAIIAFLFVDLRLIAAEEHFLELSLGQAYEAYYEKVPSLVPSLRPSVPGFGVKPCWGQAFLGEIYMWGAAAAFAFGGWRFNHNLIESCIVVSFGVAILVHAFRPKRKAIEA